MNELRDIFDRINVMVGWRTDQSNPRCRMPNLRNEPVYLRAWELTAFARFCALDDFDLQLIRVGQVIDRDTESPAGDLLNGGATPVAVRIRIKPCRVFATFTRV